MAIAYITRKEHFCAAHRLYNPSLTDDQNLAIYGECSCDNWHGHNYELLVTVKGEVDPVVGFVVNLKLVSEILNREVVSKIDHKNINLDVDFMRGIVPSTENLAIAIWRVIYEPLRQVGAELHCVRVQETQNNYVDYYGE